jgi:hypothetical protein
VTQVLTPWEINRKIDKRARVLKAAQAATPLHSACEAAEDTDGEPEAERRRARIQHLAEPYPPEVPEVAAADLDKAYREASDVPSGYPLMEPVNPEMFRRGPVRAGQSAH